MKLDFYLILKLKLSIHLFPCCLCFTKKCHAQGMQFCEINLATSVKRFSLISFIRFLLAVTFHPYPPHPQTTNSAAKVLIGGIK